MPFPCLSSSLSFSLLPFLLIFFSSYPFPSLPFPSLKYIHFFFSQDWWRTKRRCNMVFSNPQGQTGPWGVWDGDCSSRDRHGPWTDSYSGWPTQTITPSEAALIPHTKGLVQGEGGGGQEGEVDGWWNGEVQGKGREGMSLTRKSFNGDKWML